MCARGFDARTITLRPTGHPFARRAQLAASELGGARWALVVDEGPGLSGSSMAAVAEALIARRAYRAARSALVPGHDGLPGPAASPEIRAFWSSTPRYAVPLARVRLCGRSVPETLAGVLPELYGPAASVESIEDLSCGAWRGAVYAERAQWPAVCTAFERTKLRCTTRGGARYLFKFAGLGANWHGELAVCEAHAAVIKQRAELGGCPRPIADAHGFVATRWVDGTPLGVDAANAALPAQLGRYVAQSAGPRLTEEEHASAVERLENVLSANAGEALGTAAGRRVRELFVRGVRATAKRRTAARIRRRSPRAARVAAHAGGRVDQGRQHRACRRPHDRRQAIDRVGHRRRRGRVEAAAGGRSSACLVAYRAAGGEAISPSQMTAYRLAYAAFRAGQFQLCADMCSDDELEHAALQRAYGDYCAELCRVL